MTGHRISDDWAIGEFEVPDSGASGVLELKGGLTYVGLISAGAESRSLPAPTGVFQRLVIAMHDDGGNITINAGYALNAAGNTTLTFGDDDDLIELVSYYSAANGVYRWKIVGNEGVALS